MNNNIATTTDVTRGESTKVCLDKGILCNAFIKQHNVAVVEPYTFGMNHYQWDFLENVSKLEYNLALVFSLSKDQSKYSDGFWLSENRLHAHHTLLYIEFNNFIMKACLNRAAIAISLLQTTSLTFGTPKLNLMGANSLRSFAIKSMDDTEVIEDAIIIMNNKGPSILNEQLFHLIFKREYHSETIKLKRSRKGFKSINRIKEIEFMKNNNLWMNKS